MPKAVGHTKQPDTIAFGILVRLMFDGNRSMKELAEETGLNKDTVNRFCAALYHAGAIYIGNWRKDGRGAYSIRLYQAGIGVDVRPPLRTRAQRRQWMHEYRKAKKGEGPYPKPTHKEQQAYGQISSN